FQADDLINLLPARRKHNDRRLHSFTTHSATDIQSAQAGQHDVEQNQVGSFLTGEAQSFFTVPRGDHFTALVFEVVAQPQRQVRLVFNDEDSRQCCILPRSWLRQDSMVPAPSQSLLIW